MLGLLLANAIGVEGGMVDAFADGVIVQPYYPC